MVDYVRARAVADRQIRKWGAAAKLRRSGVDRDCHAMEVQLSSSERRSLKNSTSRVFLLSAVGLDVGPVKDRDELVLLVQPEGLVELPPLRLVAPTRPLAPGGYVVYWEIEVS